MEVNKLKILIGCIALANYTGSELYAYELAKQLIAEGHDVTICASLGNPMASMAKELGVKLYNISDLTKPDILSDFKNQKFDVLHLSHQPVINQIKYIFPMVPIVCTIHSEIIDIEEPIISPQIKKYIVVRPQIKDFIESKFEIKSESIEVIYNPIDTTRFKIIPDAGLRRKKRIIFVGSIDNIRKTTIADLIDTTKDTNIELWIVGNKNERYLDDMLRGHYHVRYFLPTGNVENLIEECDETAGILLGRTTIEGWLCGKKGWVYDVDSNGVIKSKQLCDIPTDLDRFDSKFVTKQIIEQYKKAINI